MIYKNYMTNIDEIISRLNNFPEKEINVDEAIISYGGYCFLFKEFEELGDLITQNDSKKLYNVGSSLELKKRFEKDPSTHNSFDYIAHLDDIIFIGSLKTLLPKETAKSFP